MRNIKFKQILILILIIFFFFGDFSNLKKTIKIFLKKLIILLIKKTGKKGLEPLSFGFGNRCSTN
jgi:hypothetical protein